MALIRIPEVQELEQEEEGAEAKKARLKAKRNAKKNEKKHAKRKDVRPNRHLFLVLCATWARHVGDGH
jgi:hypothetical protein